MTVTLQIARGRRRRLSTTLTVRPTVLDSQYAKRGIGDSRAPTNAMRTMLTESNNKMLASLPYIVET